MKKTSIAEEIEAMGQDDEVKAAKWVKEKGKENEKIQNEKDAVALEKLHDKRKQVYGYKDILLREALIRLKDYDVPSHYYIEIGKTEKGLIFGFKHFTDKQWFMKGMKVCMIPKYDLFAISLMINWALDEIGKREEKNGPATNGTKSTIIT